MPQEKTADQQMDDLVSSAIHGLISAGLIAPDLAMDIERSQELFVRLRALAVTARSVDGMVFGDLGA